MLSVQSSVFLQNGFDRIFFGSRLGLCPVLCVSSARALLTDDTCRTRRACDGHSFPPKLYLCDNN